MQIASAKQQEQPDNKTESHVSELAIGSSNVLAVVISSSNVSAVVIGSSNVLAVAIGSLVLLKVISTIESVLIQNQN